MPAKSKGRKAVSPQGLKHTGRKRNADIIPPPRPAFADLLDHIKVAESADMKARIEGLPTSVSIGVISLRNLINYAIYLERHVPRERLTAPAPALLKNLRKQAIEREARLLNPSKKWAAVEEVWADLGETVSIGTLKKWRRQADYRADVIAAFCKINLLIRGQIDTSQG